jgi:hypothetical protein
MTVRPPRVMFAVPVIAERRETLLPESCYHVSPARLNNSYIVHIEESARPHMRAK